MRGAKRQGFEYRVRYRREWGKEKTKTFGTDKGARRFQQRVKGYESDDPLFPAEKLLYAVIDRRAVGEWQRDYPEKLEHPELADLDPDNL